MSTNNKKSTPASVNMTGKTQPPQAGLQNVTLASVRILLNQVQAQQKEFIMEIQELQKSFDNLKAFIDSSTASRIDKEAALSAILAALPPGVDVEELRKAMEVN